MKKRIIILIVLIIILSILLFFCIDYKIQSDNNSKRLYKQGMIYFNKDNYSDAYYNFSQIKPVSKYYKLSLLKEFQCAFNLNDKKTALSALEKLINLTNDEVLRPYLLYNEALLNEELKLKNENWLYKKYDYISKNYPTSDFAKASDFKSARLIENINKTEAKNKYIEYLKYSPNGKYSLFSLSKIKSFSPNLTSKENEIVADSYFENKMYFDALNYYLKSDFSSSWAQISKCYRHLNNKDKEKETILLALTLKTNKVSQKELSKQLDRLAILSSSDKTLFLENLSGVYKNSYAAPAIIFKLAQKKSEINSIKLYEKIYKEYPNSYFASNSLWEIFWYYYRQKKYDNCIKIANYHKTKYSANIDASRIQYWLGRVYQNKKNFIKARETYNEVISNYPLDYYAFLAYSKSHFIKLSSLISKKTIVSYNMNKINSRLFNNSLLTQLAYFDDYKAIEELKIDDEYIKSWILYKKGKYSSSINLAKKEYFDGNDIEEIENKNEKKTSFKDYQLKLIYPILYENTINESALKYNQSPILFLSLIREESHFNKFAKSSVGAIGLTQLMPSTANFIQKSPVSNIELQNEKNNIEIGLKYFTYLTDYFQGNELLAILAYNAGPGSIQKWMKNLSDSQDIDEFIENVPYIETKNYIKKILSSYWIYSNIYSLKNNL